MTDQNKTDLNKSGLTLRPEILAAMNALECASVSKSVDAYSSVVSAFLVDLVADIDWLMKDKQVSKAELARRLGCSEPRISKIFGGKRNSANLTASTIARIMAALGESEVFISSPRLEQLKSSVQNKKANFKSTAERTQFDWNVTGGLDVDMVGFSIDMKVSWDAQPANENDTPFGSAQVDVA